MMVCCKNNKLQTFVFKMSYVFTCGYNVLISAVHIYCPYFLSILGEIPNLPLEDL